MNAKDPKGYYARLGVEPSVTQDTIKAAYRRLAKQLHPDKNSSPEANARFQALTEAYQTLSDPEARNAYDALRYTVAKDKPKSKPLEPICCSKCGKTTAQPRATVFTYAVSAVLVTFRKPIQGIYCSACARKLSFKASLISAFAGWWGLPWGPIVTVASIFRNAMGGHYSRSTNENLLWFNALAFLSKGNFPLSCALAQQLQTASDNEIAIGAVRLMDQLRELGVSKTSPSLKNPWTFRPLDGLAHAVLLLAVPAIFIGLSFLQEATAQGSNNFSQLPSPRLSPVPTAPRPSATRPEPTVQTESVVARCSIEPHNGTVIERFIPQPSQGHELEIKNGSGGNAIIKARDGYSGRLLFSFFVKSNSSASYTNIPDGRYRIQYAIGADLRADCKSFITVSALGQFPDVEDLFTSTTNTSIIKHQLSYTLYPVPGGNVRPQALDLSSFDAP
jgi:hypothetical protein